METARRLANLRNSALVILFVLSLTVSLQPTLAQTPTPGKYANITLVVKGSQDGLIGPDGKTHSAFIPCNFTVYVGQIVNLTIINYSNEQHSFTSTELGVNFFIPEHVSSTVPSVSNFQFTPTKIGIFRWWCALKCDIDRGAWAMTTGRDRGIGQIGFMAGYVTVINS